MAEDNQNDNGGFNFNLIIAVVLSVLLATGVSYFMMVKFGGLGNGEQEEQEQEEKVKELGPTHSLDQFLVNLSGSNSYVKLKIALEVDNEDVIEEIDDRSPQIRDTIISILRSRKMEEIKGDSSAQSLREEIRNKINQLLANGQVTNVFFTEFVVQ
ncbi:MAG: flagellar basal body-associated FliL family protein [Bacillota bacterium]